MCPLFVVFRVGTAEELRDGEAEVGVRVTGADKPPFQEVPVPGRIIDVAVIPASSRVCSPQTPHRMFVPGKDGGFCK